MSVDANGSFTNKNGKPDSEPTATPRPFLSPKTIEYLIVLQELVILLAYTIYANLEALFLWIVPPPPRSLDGEVILITGTANGIGRELCLKLGEIGGATLICWDIQKEDNEKLMRDLKGLGVSGAYSYIVDIGDRKQVEAAAAKVREDVGDVTMIINNAGIMPCHSFLSHNPKEIERAYQVNVLSHFWILREFLPAMLENNYGHIATVCSAAGLIPTRYLVPYCGTKHAVNGYLEALKDELIHDPRKPNIKFTTIYPFTVQTNLVRGIRCYTRFPSLFPILKPEEVADQLIDGIRRNYERVFVPGPIQGVSILVRMLTTKVAVASSDFVQCYVEPEQL